MWHQELCGLRSFPLPALPPLSSWLFSHPTHRARQRALSWPILCPQKAWGTNSFFHSVGLQVLIGSSSVCQALSCSWNRDRKVSKNRCNLYPERFHSWMEQRGIIFLKVIQRNMSIQSVDGKHLRALAGRFYFEKAGKSLRK